MSKYVKLLPKARARDHPMFKPSPDLLTTQIRAALVRRLHVLSVSLGQVPAAQPDVLSFNCQLNRAQYHLGRGFQFVWTWLTLGMSVGNYLDC